METPANKPVGRPKGLAKTGGRKPGSANRLPEELRRFVNQRGRPLELLAAIADGRKVSAADPDNPGLKIRVYPSLDERVSAARTLLNKVMPDLKSTELTGPNGAPLVPEAPDVDMFTTARKLAFVLSTAALEMQNRQDADARAAAVYKPDMRPADAFPAMPNAVPVPADVPPAQDEAQTVGNLTISFAERLPGGRDRFAIRDANGRVVGAAFGKDEALARAGALNMCEDSHG